MRSQLRASGGRLKGGAPFIAQATATATVAWIICHELLGHLSPFFAPIAAVIVLNQARGQRKTRLLEILFGVAGGVFIGDLLINLVDTPQAVTILVVIFLILTCTVAFGASPITTIQATISAVFLVVIPPQSLSDVPQRFIDALVGGGAALLVSQLSAMRNPVAPLIAAASSLFDELRAVLTDLSASLESGDTSQAREALTRARQADERFKAVQSASSAAGEALWLNISHREQRGGMRDVESVEHHIDYFVRNIRVLARAISALNRQTHKAWPELAEATALLATALDDAKELFDLTLRGEDAAREVAMTVQRVALQAVSKAGEAGNDAAGLAPFMVIGQIRSAALDLMRLAGADDQTSLDQVDEVLGMESN